METLKLLLCDLAASFGKKNWIVDKRDLPVSWAFPMVKRKSAGGEVAKPKAKKGKEEALPPVEAKQLAMPHVKIFKEWL